jgi:hypothetical protein
MGFDRVRCSACHTATMRASWIRSAGIALALVIAAAVLSGCGAPPPPTVTQPPEPVDAVAWPDVVWAGTFAGRPPDGFTTERMIAVAASNLGFVAVGVAEALGRQRGQAWFSADGTQWERIGPDALFDNVAFIDVAAGPGGFVALADLVGDARPPNRPRLVLLRSPDGRRWERIPDVSGVPQGYAGAIGGGPSGYVAVGYRDPEPGPILLVSADGLDWRLVDPATAGDVSGGVYAPIAVDDGWLAVGSPGGALSMLRSDDGATWAATTVEGSDTNGINLSRVLRGPHGLIATGLAGDGCGPFSSCPGWAVAWWSADGAAWGRIVGLDSGIAQGALTVHPERGFVAVTGSSGWSSPDGWTWSPLGDISDGGSGAVDVAVRGDRLVAVGDLYEPDGSTRALFHIGGPDIEVLN